MGFKVALTFQSIAETLDQLWPLIATDEIKTSEHYFLVNYRALYYFVQGLTRWTIRLHQGLRWKGKAI